MKTVCLNILLAFVCLLPNLTGFSRDIPVLPFPQYAEQGNPITPFSSRVKFEIKGLDKQATTRLTDHWSQFAGTATGTGYTKVTMGILGKDKKFDSQIKSKASATLTKIGAEGYILIFNINEKLIAANTETGLFYALQSLKQLTRAAWSNEIFIADWPSFPHRVIYDDISRGPISTLDYIKQQIERMAEIKINGLSFYIEHVVQPVSHPDFAPDSGKLTIPQIKELSAYAAQHHMQLIGSFQSFGHFEKILALPQYKSMGETSTLISPLDPKAREFLENVIGELCDAFSSPYFNVNCDETFDLTKGRSKKYIDSIGAARFYADHLKFLYDIVKRHNKTMMMWGDVALEHEEVLDMLPKDIVYLTWEYGDKKSYDQWILPFKKRGLTFMVCPGILNSYRMFPDMTMAKANIRGFLEAGLANGSKGAFTTIWDDGGTYLFSADWYGVYMAADKSWNADVKPESTFNSRYETNAYGTANGAYVKALFKLMELRALPATFNLNDQVWRQKVLSDDGKQLIINNSSVKEALAFVNEALRTLDSSSAKWNNSDIEILRFSLEQYKLILDTKLQIAAVVVHYNKAIKTAVTQPENVRKTLLNAGAVIQSLTDRYSELKSAFKTAWLKENQPYWLNNILAGYDKKITDFQALSVRLKKDLSSFNSGKPLWAASVQLNIKETPDYYFQNWMLGGPFPYQTTDKLPSFLYSENPEYNKPPKPGDFTHYKGITYRWQKFASQNGGVIDLDENYQSPVNALGYAYCNVTTDKAQTAEAFISGNPGMEVYLNGDRVYSDQSAAFSAEEKKMQLSFKAGINHLLVKVPKSTGKPWVFTFRLDSNLTVHTSKHKYQLNAKKTIYDAE